MKPVESLLYNYAGSQYSKYTYTTPFTKDLTSKPRLNRNSYQTTCRFYSCILYHGKLGEGREYDMPNGVR